MMVRVVAQVVSYLALAGTIVPCLLYFNGSLDLDGTKLAMLIATIVWFVATPLWMGRERQGEGAAVAGSSTEA